jgi:hypothetical protein
VIGYKSLLDSSQRHAVAILGIKLFLYAHVYIYNSDGRTSTWTYTEEMATYHIPLRELKRYISLLHNISNIFRDSSKEQIYIKDNA